MPPLNVRLATLKGEFVWLVNIPLDRDKPGSNRSWFYSTWG
jgi:hypothetical protein